jgi:hypothetical protein
MWTCARHEDKQHKAARGRNQSELPLEQILVRFPLVAKFLPEKQAFKHL